MPAQPTPFQPCPQLQPVYRVLVLLLLLCTGMLKAAPVQAQTLPQKIWTVDFRKGQHAFDWARRYPYALNDYEPAVLPHSWSADGQQLLCEGWYTGGSPIDTIDALYLLNVPARASYRLYTTGKRGANDPGIVWSWNSSQDRLYYQTRGGTQPGQTGLWSWHTPTQTYRYLPGPAHLPKGFWLREIEGQQGFSRYASEATEHELLWHWQTRKLVPVQAVDSNQIDERNRISNRQQSAPVVSLQQRGEAGTVQIKHPLRPQHWELPLAHEHLLFQQAEAPEQLLVLEQLPAKIQLTLYQFGDRHPRKRLLLSDPAPLADLQLLWSKRHAQVVLLTDSLYLLDPQALSVKRVAEGLTGSSKTLLLNPQQSLLLVSSQQWQQAPFGTIMHLFRW